jgi:ketosteroid isomerase-like protein
MARSIGRKMLTAAAAGAFALPAAQAAYAASVGALLRRTLRRLREGDVEAVLRLYHDDVRFIFPGENSWAADFHRKQDLEPWFRRFVRVGLQLEAEEILVKGPPWNTTVCVRFTDRAAGDDGSTVYENRGVIVLKVRWGKVAYEIAHEDTERVAAFDRYLAEHEPPPGTERVAVAP